MHKLSALLLLGLLGVSVALPGEGESFLKLSTGVGLTADSDLEVRQSGGTDLTFDDVEWEDHSLSGPSARYLDVRFGHFFKSKPWLGLALDFLHYKVFAEVGRSVRVHGTNAGTPIDGVGTMSSIVGYYAVANGVNLLPVSVIARWRLDPDEHRPHGRWQPYVGGGVGPTLLYTQSTVNGQTRNGSYELGRPALQAIGGVQLQLGRHWDVFTELKLTYTEVNGSIAGGSSRAELWSRHLTAGAGFHF
jgi:hypothetical protein